MMSTPIFLQMRASRPIMFGGQRIEAGESITVSLPTASELQRSGRARVVDPADLALLADQRVQRRVRGYIGGRSA